MKTHKKHSTEENTTFTILDEIQEVKVSPFFKGKVLNAIQQQKEAKEETSSGFSWFTPQLQLATLAILVSINIAVVYYSFSYENTPTEVSGIDSFIEEYQLGSTTLSLNQ